MPIALPLTCVSGSAYIVEVYGRENIVVIAENIDDACNKLDKAGILDYGFVYCKSFNVLS